MYYVKLFVILCAAGACLAFPFTAYTMLMSEVGSIPKENYVYGALTAPFTGIILGLVCMAIILAFFASCYEVSVLIYHKIRGTTDEEQIDLLIFSQGSEEISHCRIFFASFCFNIFLTFSLVGYMMLGDIRNSIPESYVTYGLWMKIIAGSAFFVNCGIMTLSFFICCRENLKDAYRGVIKDIADELRGAGDVETVA